MYEIAIQLSIPELQDYVNRKLQDGFKPEGGVIVIPQYDISKDGRFNVEYGIQNNANAPTQFTAYAQVLIKI